MTGHDRSPHEHGYSHASEHRIFWAALLTGGFMLAEVAGGLLSGSLALLADAGHMLTDAAALALAWFAFRVARRPADWKRTYGFDRFQILIAFVNGLVLFAIAAWVVAEAISQFFEPVPVLGGPMLVVAIAGLLVNIVSFALLHGADHENLNVRSAALHVLGDLLGSVAAIAAAVVILTTGWTPIDPLLSVLVACLILRSAWRVVRDSGQILLESAPAHLDVREIERDLSETVDEIDGVHHVHAWSLTEKRPLITLHAIASATAAPETVARAVKLRLRERFGIDHATVEVEHHNATCAD